MSYNSSSPLIIALTVGLVIFVLVGIIACIRRRRRLAGQVIRAPVVVTSATHTTVPTAYPTSIEPTPNGGGYQVTPYPTSMPMPQPYSGVHPPYPTAPGMPPMQGSYPPVAPSAGFQAPVGPYPSEPPMFQMNPPTYEQVVAGGDSTYTKQTPYNPHYTGTGTG